MYIVNEECSVIKNQILILKFLEFDCDERFRSGEERVH